MSGFWKGKKVFLTGHTGFKGSWMSHVLARRGANVVGFSLAPPTEPSLFIASGAAQVCESLEGDIRNLDLLVRAVQKAKPDVIIHMAAQALVRDSYTTPVETYATNVMGTVNLMEAARRSPHAKVFINVTSDKCYENFEREAGYREDEAMGGSDPYSSSKGCAELVTQSFRKSFFSQGNPLLASGRAGNVVGGGDWARDRLIPDAVRAFSKNQAVEIRNPRAVRPWQHVLDPVVGYLFLAERLWDNPKFAEGWNFGPNQHDAKPVEWVLNEFCKNWGDDARWNLKEDPSGLKEAFYLKLDCTKAHEILKWKPVFDIQTTVKLTAEWYKGFYNGRAARDLVENDISIFEKQSWS